MVRLITGASGFIGRNLTGDIRLSSVDCDLTVRDDVVALLGRTKPDSVLHCAAMHGSSTQMRGNHSGFLDANVQMDSNLLFAAKEAAVSNILMVSSTSVFSEAAPRPYSEKHLVFDSDDAYLGYSFSKRHMIRATAAYQRDFDLNWKTVLLGNSYGPGMKVASDSTVIGAILHKFRQAIQNDTDVVLFGDGSDTRNFTYVEDLDAVFSALIADRTWVRPVIVSSEEVSSVSDIAQTLKNLLGVRRRIVFEGPANVNNRVKTVETTLLKQLVPSAVFTPLEVGLEKTVSWFIEEFLRPSG